MQHAWLLFLFLSRPLCSGKFLWETGFFQSSRAELRWELASLGSSAPSRTHWPIAFLRPQRLVRKAPGLQTPAPACDGALCGCDRGNTTERPPDSPSDCVCVEGEGEGRSPSGFPASHACQGMWSGTEEFHSWVQGGALRARHPPGSPGSQLACVEGLAFANRAGKLRGKKLPKG